MNTYRSCTCVLDSSDLSACKIITNISCSISLKMVVVINALSFYASVTYLRRIASLLTVPSFQKEKMSMQDTVHSILLHTYIDALPTCQETCSLSFAYRSYEQNTKKSPYDVRRMHSNFSCFT